MRLNAQQISTIKVAVTEVFGSDSRVWLFGSRVDDTARGGDIDLLVQPASAPGRSMLMDKVSLLGKLERLLGERKIDLIIEEADDVRPIVRIAHQTGVPL